MALIDKENIRAEIDKRYAEYRAKMKTDDFTYYEGMADALDLFEQFLDTLPEQPDKETILRICKLHKVWSIMAPWENVEDFVMTNWNSENIV